MSFRRNLTAVFLLIALGSPCASAEQETVITFADVEIGKPVPSWTAKGVAIEPGGSLRRSTARPRIMFFPHLMTEKKGVLNAIANEAIPVQIRFPNGASRVTLVLWGSITSSALVEAIDQEGKVVDKAAREKVPHRESPADPIPSFELTVQAPRISSVRFSGAYPGGFLAAEEIRFLPLQGKQPK